MEATALGLNAQAAGYSTQLNDHLVGIYYVQQPWEMRERNSRTETMSLPLDTLGPVLGTKQPL